MPRPHAILAALALALGAASATAEPSRPNVLFLVSDDLNMEVGAFGSKRAVTPHLDRLAREGMRFDRAFCQYPVCGPSRNSFLSGLRPETIGFPEEGWPNLRTMVPEVTTLPQLFRENGYETLSIGKIFHISFWDPVHPTADSWRLGDAASWDYRFNAKPANMGPRSAPPFPFEGRRLEIPGGTGLNFSLISSESDLAQTDGQATQQAILQLDRLHRDKRPFFMAVGFRRPHAPFIAPERYFWPHPRKSITVPDPGDRSDTPAAAFNVHPPHYGEPEAMKNLTMGYLASVSFMDAQVGRLLDRLEELGIADDTIVVFFSDHGFALGERGNWHKFTLFEESTRVPLIIRAPGVTSAGSRSERLVELVDLYPTLRELCGLPAPVQALEGDSLLPLLAKPDAEAGANRAVTQVRRNSVAGRKLDAPLMGYSLRTPDHRYNEWWTTGTEPSLHAAELYDLRQDPGEEHNLAESSDHADLRDRLAKQLAGYRRDAPER